MTTLYSDLNTFFKKDSLSNELISTSMETIKNSVLRFFTTGKGEVPFNRAYGTILKSLLFENELSNNDVQTFLYMELTTYEPRILLSPADIVIERTAEHQFSISCSFLVPLLNNELGNVSVTVSEN